MRRASGELLPSAAFRRGEVGVGATRGCAECVFDGEPAVHAVYIKAREDKRGVKSLVGRVCVLLPCCFRDEGCARPLPPPHHAIAPATSSGRRARRFSTSLMFFDPFRFLRGALEQQAASVHGGAPPHDERKPHLIAAFIYRTDCSNGVITTSPLPPLPRIVSPSPSSSSPSSSSPPLPPVLAPFSA